MTGRAFALFGTPIERSPSPAMHNAAFAALGIEGSYHLRAADREEAAEAIFAQLPPKAITP